MTARILNDQCGENAAATCSATGSMMLAKISLAGPWVARTATITAAVTSGVSATSRRRSRISRQPSSGLLSVAALTNRACYSRSAACRNERLLQAEQLRAAVPGKARAVHAGQHGRLEGGQRIEHGAGGG